MKGLIAKRPILYRGRMYQAGDNLPGDDTRMVEAWLENDSAERSGEAQDNATAAQEPPKEPEKGREVSEDKGAENADQGGQEPHQEPEKGREVSEDKGAENADQGGQEPHQEPEKGREVSEDKGAEDAAQGTQEPPQEGGAEAGGGMIAGHLDPKDLEGLKKADLERMATDMGLDISEAKTKADLIAVITAAEVYAPAEDKNGGAQ